MASMRSALGESRAGRKGEVDAELMGTSAWTLREVDVRDRRRYIAEGWWGDQSVGQRMADGLAAHRDLPFVIHSRTRPWRGTFGDVLDLARRAASGLVGPRRRARRRRHVSDPELARGRNHVLRRRNRGSRGGTDRAHLRDPRDVVHPQRVQAEGARHRHTLRPPGLFVEPGVDAWCPRDAVDRPRPARTGRQHRIRTSCWNRLPSVHPWPSTPARLPSWVGRRAPRRARRAWCTRIKRSAPRSRSSVRPRHRPSDRRSWRIPSVTPSECWVRS